MIWKVKFLSCKCHRNSDVYNGKSNQYLLFIVARVYDLEVMNTITFSTNIYVLPQADQFLSKQMHDHKVTTAHPLWRVQDPEKAKGKQIILL